MRRGYISFSFIFLLVNASAFLATDNNCAIPKDFEEVGEFCSLN